MQLLCNGCTVSLLFFFFLGLFFAVIIGSNKNVVVLRAGVCLFIY